MVCRRYYTINISLLVSKNTTKYQKMNLPTMATSVNALACPAVFSAAHVYRPLSSDLVSVIDKESSSSTESLSFRSNSCPFLYHVIFGWGTPLAWHLIVTDVLSNAETSLPISKVTMRLSGIEMCCRSLGVLI